MIKGIYIFGASGTGTTTIGSELSKVLDFTHLDCDDFCWYETDPPFTQRRPIQESQNLLLREINRSNKWVMSGSHYRWGDIVIDYLDLVIYIWIPTNTRIKRIEKRDREKYGDRILMNRDMFDGYSRYIENASNYDSGGFNMNSKLQHEVWLRQLQCPILLFKKELTVGEYVEIICSVIMSIDNNQK